MRLDSAWGSYFLAPVILAVGWILLELGNVSNVKKLQQIALAFPLVCLGLSVPFASSSIPHTVFLEKFTQTLASPIYLSLIGAVVFYSIAFWKKVPNADLGLAFAICLFAVIGPETLNRQTTISPRSAPLILAGVLLVVRGRNNSLMVFAGLLFGAAALRFSLPRDCPEFWRNAIGLHLMGLAVLSVGLIYRDAFAGFLRSAAAVLMAFGVVFAQFGGRWLPPDLPPWMIPSYTVGLTIIAFALAYRLWDRYFLAVGLLNLALAWMLLAREAYRSLRTLPEWPGIASFGLAFLLLAVGERSAPSKPASSRESKDLNED